MRNAEIELVSLFEPPVQIRHLCLWQFMPPFNPPCLIEYVRRCGPVRNPSPQRQRYRRKLVIWPVTWGYCFYCSAPVDFISFEPDHFMPRSKGGNDDPANLVPACHRCNASKRDLFYGEWIDLIASGRSKRRDAVELVR